MFRIPVTDRSGSSPDRHVWDCFALGARYALSSVQFAKINVVLSAECEALYKVIV